MRESRTYGFVRGAHSDMRPYRDPDIAVTGYRPTSKWPERTSFASNG